LWALRNRRTVANVRSRDLPFGLIEGFGHFVTSMPAPTASGWSDVTGRASHPLESAALSRRTPFPGIASNA
jgi:hypothetical protein